MACLPCMLALLGYEEPVMPIGFSGLAANSLGQQQWDALDLNEKHLRSIVNTMSSGPVADSLYAALNAVRTTLSQSAGGSMQYTTMTLPIVGRITVPSGKARSPDWETGTGALWDMEYKRMWAQLQDIERQLAQRAGVPTLTQQPPQQPAVTEAANPEGTGTPYEYKGAPASIIGPTGWDYVTPPMAAKSTNWSGIVAVVAIVGAAAYFLWPKKGRKR